MDAVMMRTGYLAVPDYFRAETAKSGEGFIERLTRRRLGQCNHYMMLTKHKMDCPKQYQGVLFSFEK